MTFKDSKYNIKSIYELIDSEIFRKRPGMYLGEKSIIGLKKYMDGYRLCEDFNNIKSEDTSPPFWMFMHFVNQRYGLELSSQNWDGVIINKFEGNEPKAFDEFFILFDEFRLMKESDIKIQ